MPNSKPTECDLDESTIKFENDTFSIFDNNYFSAFCRTCKSIHNFQTTGLTEFNPGSIAMNLAEDDHTTFSFTNIADDLLD